jgi:hypothetical protein
MRETCFGEVSPRTDGVKGECYGAVVNHLKGSFQRRAGENQFRFAIKTIPKFRILFSIPSDDAGPSASWWGKTLSATAGHPAILGPHHQWLKLPKNRKIPTLTLAISFLASNFGRIYPIN